MAAGLGLPMKPVVMPSYPHLLQEDTVVWSRWLAKNAHRVQGCWYDVRVGVPVSVPTGLHVSIDAVALGVTRKRIDVVCQTAGGIWVVEVKPYGNFTSLGQALVYARMFSVEYNAGLPVVSMVVCAEIDPDLVDDFRDHGVLYEEVGFGP